MVERLGVDRAALRRSRYIREIERNCAVCSEHRRCRAWLDSGAHYYLAQILKSQDKTSAAIDELEACVKVNPDYPNAQNSLGLLLEQSGDAERAIAAFRAEKCGDASPHSNGRRWLRPAEKKISQALSELDRPDAFSGRAGGIDGKRPSRARRPFHIRPWR